MEFINFSIIYVIMLSLFFKANKYCKRQFAQKTILKAAQ